MRFLRIGSSWKASHDGNKNVIKQELAVQWPYTCVINICTFRSRPQQDNEMTIFGERWPRQQICGMSLWNWNQVFFVGVISGVVVVTTWKRGRGGQIQYGGRQRCEHCASFSASVSCNTEAKTPTDISNPSLCCCLFIAVNHCFLICQFLGK